MIRIISILLFFQIVFCNHSFAEEFEIRHADSLEATKDQIIIKGNISINYKKASIEANEGKIETNSNSEPIKATFFPKARFSMKDRKLEADKITILIKDTTIYAEGNILTKLKDKENNPITINSDYQELFWSGEGANAKGNLTTIYKDTKVRADEAKIIYRNKKPYQAIFFSYSKPSNLEQPTSITSAKEFIFDVKTHNVQAFGDVKSIIWPDKNKSKNEQDPINLSTQDLFIDNNSNSVIAKDEKRKVRITYQNTKGESLEAILLKEVENGKLEKIIFKGSAKVIQEDKQISSEEVVFNFKDKKLTSNTKTNIRPKTIIFKSHGTRS